MKPVWLARIGCVAALSATVLLGCGSDPAPGQTNGNSGTGGSAALAGSGGQPLGGVAGMVASGGAPGGTGNAAGGANGGNSNAGGNGTSGTGGTPSAAGAAGGGGVGGSCMSASCQAPAVVTYPNLPDAVESPLYTVTVNGTKLFVEKMTKFAPEMQVHYAHVSLAGADPAMFSVTVNESFTAFTLSPKSRNITPTKSG